MAGPDVDEAYRTLSREWRNIVTDLLKEEGYAYLKASKNKGREGEKYQVQIIARRRRYHQGLEDGQEPGGLVVGRNQLVVNVRGPCYEEGFSLGYGDKDGFCGPILVRFGEGLRKLGHPAPLEERLNEVGEAYRCKEYGREFLCELLRVCDAYVGGLKTTQGL